MKGRLRPAQSQCTPDDSVHLREARDVCHAHTSDHRSPCQSLDSAMPKEGKGGP